MYRNKDREKCKDVQGEMYRELAQLGADAVAFRRVRPTEEQLAMLIQGIKRLRSCPDLQHTPAQLT